MPATEDPPTLPQTEAAVRLMLDVHRVAMHRPQTSPAAAFKIGQFLQDYDDAVMLLRQDAVTAYATAWRAMRARERTQQERMA